MSGAGAGAFGLAAATPGAWFERAACELPTLLIDHANCEKKAASTALGLMFAYAEDAPLCLALARLAREELRHYEQVLRVLRGQGIGWRRLSPSRYAGELRRAVARAEPARQLDLLISGALIEARSCERFARLAVLLPAAIGSLYGALQAAEARHAEFYVDSAARHAERHGLDLAAHCAALAALEGRLATEPDDEFRFHSGPPAVSAGA
jgi:tRNA-(ms[2]io[6]A)-hydroxylase